MIKLVLSKVKTPFLKSWICHRGPLALLPVKVIRWAERVVGPLALLLVRVTKQASRVGGLAKTLLFLVICPVSGIHQLLTLLMTSSLNVGPALIK